MLVGLDSKCEKIIECFLVSNDKLNVQEISNRTNINKRSIYYNISKINEWLENNHIETIAVNGKGLKLDENQKNKIKELLKKRPKYIDYQFLPNERISIIITELIIKNGKIYVENLMEKCSVSRNSILSDLKIVENKLMKSNLILNYNIKDGYFISGDVIKKRSLFFLEFNKIINFYKNNIIKLDNKEKIDDIYIKLNKIATNLNVDYVEGTIYSISVLFSTLMNSLEKTVFSIKDKIEISNSSEYKIVCEYFDEYDEGDKLYLTLHLLGSRLKSTASSVIQENYSESYFLATGLVDEFSRIACVEFEDKPELIKSLCTHLKSSLYRYKYGIQLDNPMLNEIKKEYSDLFKITKQACKYIEFELKIPIPDSEIAYITLHFGSYLDYKMLYKKKIKVMIICPNGISTASMLKKEVSILLPNAQVDSCSFNINEDELENYELVIMTVSNTQYKKYKGILIVNPILTDNDRVMIMRKCMDFSDKDMNMLDSIIKIAEKYIKKDEMKSFKADLLNKLKENREVKIQADFKPIQHGLIQFLEPEFVHIFKESMSWQNSIKILGNQLVNKKYVKKEYVDSIINSINEIGPYMFITSDIVLAHAKPSDGTIELGINLGIFHEKIKFPDEKYAKIIFFISAIDQVSHLHILSDIVNIASDEKLVNEICGLKNEEEILYVINEKLNSK